MISKFWINWKSNQTHILKKFNIPIKNSNESNGLTTIYVYKSKSKNNIFYIYKNRKQCKGKGKINIKKKQFIIAYKCDEIIIHFNIDYNEFIGLLKKKNWIK